MHILVMPGLTFPEPDPEVLARIRAAAGPGARVSVVADPEQAIGLAADVEVILGVVPKRLFAAAPRLRWVHAITSGVDMFLYPEFVRSDVLLTGEKGLVGEHLADHGFGLLLALTRKIAAAQALGHQAWQHREALRRGELELTGATMGIIGLGGTGRSMARRAVAFGMHCIAVDREPVPSAPEVSDVWPLSRLPELLRMSDVVAICCPLTRETRGMFDAGTFDMVRPGAFLVNVTRGEVMDEAALVAALTVGNLRCAALDVAPREPLPPDSELWRLPNVVMTPHTAGASQYRAGRNLERFLANLGFLRAGHPLEGLVDKQLGY